MRFVSAVALVLLVGCNARPTGRERSAPASPAPASPAPASPAQPAPPQDTADVRASVRSVPRTDWPCRIDVRNMDLAIWTPVYEGPTACWIPIELQADGIVGCPSELSVENPKARYKNTQSFRYDDAGHLVEIIRGTRSTGFAWEGDRLAQDESTGSSYELKRDTIVKLSSDGQPRLRARVDRGRLAQLEYVDDTRVTGVAALQWTNGRLASIELRSMVIADDVTRKTPIYDCSR